MMVLNTLRHRRFLIVGTALLIGCTSAAPSTGSPSPQVTPEPSTTPSASLDASPMASNDPSPSPSPSASPVQGDPLLNTVVVTVADSLRIRSQPRVSDDSIKYEPVLPLGTRLNVVGGPIVASGYSWYEVEPVELALDGGVTRGWVASADHDGTPWVDLAGAPLVDLRVGDWVNVVTSSLRVRADPGLSATMIATLHSGEIALVTEERKTVDGYDWYGVTTLVAPHGWVASGTTGERFLRFLSRERLVTRCGKVLNTDPVVVGSMVVPATAINGTSLAVLHLVKSVEATGCLTVVRDGDGLAVRVDAGTSACGAPQWDGQHLRLAPTLAGDVVAEYRVRTTVLVADVLLTEGVGVGPEGRTNLQNVLILASGAPTPFGCVHSRVREGETGEREQVVMTDLVQCVVATERDPDHILLRSSAGGNALWFGFTGTTTIDSLLIGAPTPMNITAMVDNAQYPGGFFSLLANSVRGCGG